MSSIGESRREIKHSSRGRELQGPRPSPLKVRNSSSMIKKPSHDIRNRSSSSGGGEVVHPVVIYLRSPKIIHVRPEEFMSLVQRLTGKDSSADESCNPSSSSPSSSSCEMVGGDRDESMAAKMTERSSDHNVFLADMKQPFNGDDLCDQILEMSPTWLRFLACV